MNIFVLSEDTEACAKMHCDKHVVKMILESAQLLSTAQLVLDGTPEKYKSAANRTLTRYVHRLDSVLYKATHINHPCAIWVRQSKENYNWLYSLFSCLCTEYTFRYSKVHLTEKKLLDVLKTPPANIPDLPRTPFTQAMPDEYKSTDAVKAYRDYYVHSKADIAKWTKREQPDWFKL